MNYLIAKAIQGPKKDADTRKEQQKKRLRLRAQVNMRCLRNPNKLVPKEDWESSFSSRKIVKKVYCCSTSKGTELSCISWTDLNHRCAVITGLAVAPDGQWQIVAVPIGHRSHVHRPRSATPRCTIKEIPPQDKDNGNKLLVSKEDKPRKRSSSKKVKKKAKKNKKHSGETRLTELDCGSKNVASQCGATNGDHNTVLLPDATKLASPGEEVGDPESLKIPGEKSSDELAKSEKKSKKVTHNSSWRCVNGVGNFRGQSGRESDHFVWQKVQKDDACECNGDTETVNSCISECDNKLKETPLRERDNNRSTASLISDSEVKKQENMKVFGKMKRKSNPNSKKVCAYYYRKGPQVVKPRLNLCTEVDIKQNKIHALPVQTNGENGNEAVISSDSPGLCTSGSLSVKLEEQSAEISSPSNSEEVLPASNPKCLHAMSSSEIDPTICPNDFRGSTSKDVVELENLKNETASNISSCSNDYGGSKCYIPETKNQNVLASDSYSGHILSAVHDSHRVQLTTEAIGLATGRPIAEFEKILQSVSPVLCKSQGIGDCRTCSDDSVVPAPLCRHQIPNISLGGLWQWYEQHGSYGLEVRANDYMNSKRMGLDSTAFRAYFVPYLSAVQLFSNHDNTLVSSPAKAGEMNKESRSSSSNDQCIFSSLIPQPGVPENPLNYSELLEVSISENDSNSSVQCERYDDLELLFEYFESEPPQRRRPICEKIKELVRGDVPPQCRAYGNASILNSVALRDLHPRSWYSVAWYPIYRIPEANFRAAFLTYHSLGHFINRQAVSGSARKDAYIVSPVVGLQSYNAKDECWFHWRNSDAETAGILRDRLRTLEHVASVLARSVVTKGNETSTNRHPDYEFFFSGQR